MIKKKKFTTKKINVFEWLTCDVKTKIKSYHQQHRRSNLRSNDKTSFCCFIQPTMRSIIMVHLKLSFEIFPIFYGIHLGV